MDTSWSHFALLVVGVCIMLTGVGGWFALADADYQYRYVTTEDRYPSDEGNLGYYDSLSPKERNVVDRAMNGEAPRLESDEHLPPDVVKKNGSYHVFRGYSHYDWADPRTFGPTGVGVLGLGVMVVAMRRDVRDRGVR